MTESFEAPVRDRPVYVRPAGRVLGRQVPLAELEDPVVAEHLELLESEGVSGAGVAEVSSIELAAAVVPSFTGRAVIGDVQPDVIVVCTDTLEGVDPSDWMARFQKLSGTELTTTLMVSGHACANLVLGLETCRGLIASGVAETAMLVTADRVATGTRFEVLNNSVYSDGAAACLLTTEPGSSFRIVGSGMQGQAQVRREGGMAAARATLLTMAAASNRALGGRPSSDVRTVLSLNLGTTARTLLAMAASVPVNAVRSGTPASRGHCFSADVLFAMDELLADESCRPDDDVLILVSGRHVQSAMLLSRSSG